VLDDEEGSEDELLFRFLCFLFDFLSFFDSLSSVLTLVVVVVVGWSGVAYFKAEVSTGFHKYASANHTAACRS